MSFLLFLTMAVDIVSEKAKGNQLDVGFTRERAALNLRGWISMDFDIETPMNVSEKP